MNEVREAAYAAAAAAYASADAAYAASAGQLRSLAYSAKLVREIIPFEIINEALTKLK